MSFSVLVASYAYDTLGRSVKKKTYDSNCDLEFTAHYYYNTKWQVLTTTDGAGNNARNYVYGNYIDEALLMIDGSSDYYYTHNHLYSCVALLDNTGSVLERYEYNAYGKPTIYNANFSQTRTTSQYNNDILFTGREVDFLDAGSLTLQYNRNRYYDYDTGRWLTQDPLGYVDCLNLYEYVVSNPLFNYDPLGLSRVSGTNRYHTLLHAKDIVNRLYNKCCQNADGCKCGCAQLDILRAAITLKLADFTAAVGGSLPEGVTLQDLADKSGQIKNFLDNINDKMDKGLNLRNHLYDTGTLRPPGRRYRGKINTVGTFYEPEDIGEAIGHIQSKYEQIDTILQVINIFHSTNPNSSPEIVRGLAGILQAGEAFAPPGVSDILGYYEGALNAIAGKMGNINVDLGNPELANLDGLDCADIGKTNLNVYYGGEFSINWAKGILNDFAQKMGKGKSGKVEEYEEKCQ